VSVIDLSDCAPSLAHGGSKFVIFYLESKNRSNP
jgi:hypothetical protein